jgi:uncharacterized protein YbjT (DUF2867 family)
MILVTGATGNAGGAVVQALAAMGEPVRALIRKADDQARLPEGADGIFGDLDDPASLREPLDGVSAVFLLSGYRGMPDTLAIARAAGVERVVLLSSSAASSGNLDNAIAAYHILSERDVQDSGLPYTFLQLNAFMSNTFRWLPQLRDGDVIRDAFGDVPAAMIDPDDLGAVAALTLRTADHEGQVYRLSGPQPLLPADRVAMLAGALSRDLRFDAWDDEEARVQMSATMPQKYVDAFFDFYRAGTIDESTVLPTVQQITGRRPRAYEQWLAAHADQLREGSQSGRNREEASPSPTRSPPAS